MLVRRTAGHFSALQIETKRKRRRRRRKKKDEEDITEGKNKGKENKNTYTLFPGRGKRNGRGNVVCVKYTRSSRQSI